MSTPVFNAANFERGDEIDNPYLTYTPGTTFVSESPDGSVVDNFQVTDRTLMVDGAQTAVIVDTVTVDGVTEEIATDYFAQDKAGNVWYFGEDVMNFIGGSLDNTSGTWRAGADGALPGIIMESHPKVGDTYAQENAPGVAQDQAEVLSKHGHETLESGSVKNLLQIQETTPLDPTALEQKFYLRGVGEVLSLDLTSGERLELVSIQHDGKEVSLSDLPISGHRGDAGGGSSWGSMDNSAPNHGTDFTLSGGQWVTMSFGT
jgi:hypothetical protein